jgi:hypothetical protein
MPAGIHPLYRDGDFEQDRRSGDFSKEYDCYLLKFISDRFINLYQLVTQYLTHSSGELYR